MPEGAAVTLPRTRAQLDATSFLTLYVALLLLVPSRLIVGPLGAAGTPAQILAVLGLGWWSLHQLSRPFPDPGQLYPVRRAMGLFAAAVLASYVAATTRAIDVLELSTAEQGLISLASWAGVLLVIHDGVPDRDRLDTILRRVVVLGGLVGALGILQFATKRAYTDLIQIPGLTINRSLDSVLSRDGFARPAGTALHPIEFGVVMTTLLPLAVHYLSAGPSARRVRQWFPVAAMAFAIPLSISRSAVLGAVIVLAFLMPTWTRAVRLKALAGIGFGLLAVFVLVPGILGAIARLFTGIGQDASVRSRSDSYDMAFAFVSRSPLFGRGFLTFLPEYRILDNQYLALLIDTGVVGVVSMLVLLGAGVLVPLRVRRRSTDRVTRSLAQSLAASSAAAAGCYAFFDALSFPMLAGTTFLVLGASGALARLESR